MTAIRILELGQDAELSRQARGVFQDDLKTSSQTGIVLFQRQSNQETELAEDTAQNADVVLALCRSAAEATDLARIIEQQPGNPPRLFFTTTEAKPKLLRMPELVAWDVIAADEMNRLALAVVNAAEVAETRLREARLQEELGQAKNLLLKNQKSITVGRLLGSIAHEINNPLEAVANLLYLAQRQASGEGDPSVCIEMAEKELQRVGDITRQMLSFHRESRSMEKILVTGAMETGLALFETRLRHAGVDVVRQYRSTGCLLAYAGELRQIFSNLIANSVDAMPAGGKLLVRVQERLGDRPTLCITIADTGVGMPREVAERVGDLFFTTKGETGTGLGMWVTRQLVEKHGGTMRVYSSTTPGRSGTVFRMVFTEPQAQFRDPLEVEAEGSLLWKRGDEPDASGEGPEENFGPEFMSA